MANTTWSDDEYGRVARALLYPASRTAVVIQGYSGSSQPIAWQLDGRLQQVTPPAKTEALALADRILTQEQAYEDAIGIPPDVRGVGDIKLEAKYGLQTREIVMRRMRARLALLIDFKVNEVGDDMLGGGGGGSINAVAVA